MRTYLAVLAFFCGGMLFDTVCLAQSDSVFPVANDSNSVDQSIGSTESSGMLEGWIDQAKDKLTHSALATMFGDSAEPIEQSMNVYSGGSHMINDGFAAISKSTAWIESPSLEGGDGGAAAEQFLNGGAQTDVLRAVPGGSTLISAVKGAQALSNNLGAAESDVESLGTKLNSYLTGSSNYGLEPGSSDAQAAQQEVDASDQSMTVDTTDIPQDVSSGTDQSSADGIQAAESESEETSNAETKSRTKSGTSDKDSGAPAESAGSTTPQWQSSGSSNDLLEELQQGGIDTNSSGIDDSSAITSSDLTAIGGSGSSDSGSSSINVQQLQSSIAQWDQEQAEKAQAEKAAEEQAEKLAQEQAERQQEAAAEAQAQEQQAEYAEQSGVNIEQSAPSQGSPAPAEKSHGFWSAFGHFAATAGAIYLGTKALQHQSQAWQAPPTLPAHGQSICELGKEAAAAGLDGSGPMKACAN